jgi:hypothetical protein
MLEDDLLSLTEAYVHHPTFDDTIPFTANFDIPSSDPDILSDSSPFYKLFITDVTMPPITDEDVLTMAILNLPSDLDDHMQCDTPSLSDGFDDLSNIINMTPSSELTSYPADGQIAPFGNLAVVSIPV